MPSSRHTSPAIIRPSPLLQFRLLTGCFSAAGISRAATRLALTYCVELHAAVPAHDLSGVYAHEVSCRRPANRAGRVFHSVSEKTYRFAERKNATRYSAVQQEAWQGGQ